jgi:mannan endo-1,4-beta-mannosidase
MYSFCKRSLIGITFLLLWALKISCAQTIVPDATAEAENGVLAGGAKVANTIAGFSGTGYVTNFTTSSDKVTVTMNVPSQGFYKLVIRYNSQNKTQDLFVNGKGPSSVVFTNTSVFADVDAGKYLLNAGNNTFTIQSNWGYINIDKFSLYLVGKNIYSPAPNLINPNANTDAKRLYAFLLSKFTVKMISGQTNDWYDKIKPIAGKSPLLRAFDFQHYTQGYAYLWDNSINGFKFGAEDDGSVQKAIDWFVQTGGTGIVSFHWHWHSPTGGQVGTNTFYTASTTFDVTKAVITGTTENTLILRDIDAIAVQLKRLQTAGIPVLWRPLHEAGGTWFWWGAKGSVACKQLYQILYDRLTNFHNLNNLIWVWSTPETDWYPGNDAVDIIGYDSYPGLYNYDPQKSAFDRLYQLTGGKKIIAMSENGPIPNPDDCLLYDAPWAYFMSWSDLVQKQNTDAHITDVFNNKNVLTVENPTSVIDNSKILKPVYNLFPNPAKEVLYIEGPPFTLLKLNDINGRIVFSTTQQINTLNTQNLDNGIYVLKTYVNQKIYENKLIIKH